MMKKQMKRTVYEAPVTERFSVELEGGIMAASVVEYEHSVETNVQGDNEINANDHDWNDTNWE